MFNDLLKFKKRMVLLNNKTSGKLAEDNYALSRSCEGYEVKRTGRGHDFVERKVDIFGKKSPKTYVEIKSSRTAPLSKLQQKKKKTSSNYKVVRSGLF